MWMSPRIVSALSSTTTTTTIAAAALGRAPTASLLTSPARSQRLLSTLTRGNYEPLRPKVSGAYWMTNRPMSSSTTPFQTGRVIQSKTPWTTAAPSSALWPRTWIAATTISGSILGPMLWARVHPGYKVAYCAAPATTTASPGLRPTSPSGAYPPNKEPLISTREITFGTVMGLGSGFLFKKLGKLILLVIGLGFVSLQLLSNQGYVTVHWGRFERRFKDSFDLDGDGKVTVNDAKYGFRALIDLLTKNFQFKSTFIGGFVLGFRYG